MPKSPLATLLTHFLNPPLRVGIYSSLAAWAHNPTSAWATRCKHEDRSVGRVNVKRSKQHRCEPGSLQCLPLPAWHPGCSVKMLMLETNSEFNPEGSGQVRQGRVFFHHGGVMAGLGEDNLPTLLGVPVSVPVPRAFKQVTLWGEVLKPPAWDHVNKSHLERLFQ